MPVPKLEYFQELHHGQSQQAHGSRRASLSRSLSASCAPSSDSSSSPAVIGGDHHHHGDFSLQWGLLLPICYRGEGDPQDCWRRLETFMASLVQTTSEADRSRLHVFIGIDEVDILYDNDKSKQRLKELFATAGVATSITMLRSSYRSKLCHIWDRLAQQAVRDGCDLFVLLGDDVKLLTPGWKAEVERTFAEIAVRRGLPFGMACVCFRDLTFKVFPTFPVIHRQHLAVFGGVLLPPAFVNQHGDPFLFELYRRWGASEFTKTVALENTIGGKGKARYAKQGANWRDGLLTSAIATMSSCVMQQQQQQQHHHHQQMLSCQGHAATLPQQLYCLNVAVPSYRCNVDYLSRITRLDVSEGRASVHILIVMDNPDSEALDSVRALEDWSPNHLVRVFVQPENMGASLSRNSGMAQSFGDWTVLLDDDVIPQDDLLDAYLGAILRHKVAKVYVGLTRLPPPATLLQYALVACKMTYFYDVALKMKHPPWGVTANLCVPGRTNNQVWFSDVYPKTGGGEDVDLCLRLKNLLPNDARDAAIVAVPEAVVHHPFWRNIIRQVAGWASGDTKCLDQLPHNAFYAPPNWAEVMLLMCLLCLVGWVSLASCVLCVSGVLVLEVVLALGTVLPEPSAGVSLPYRLLIGMLATVPALTQDAMRLYCKLSRGQLYQVCRQFDWMDGQQDHVIAVRFSLMVRCAAWAVAAASLSHLHSVACGGHVAAWGMIGLGVLAWAQSQDFDLQSWKRAFVQGLKPLPLAFDRVGGRGCSDICETSSSDSSSSGQDTTAGDGDAHGAPSATAHAQPFVVLAYQRTGSNLLCGRLHNHPEILMHNEVFNEAQISSYMESEVFGPGWDWDIFRRNSEPERFVLDLFSRVPSSSSKFQKRLPKAVGFKLFPEHWEGGGFERAEVLQRLLADPRVKKVVLRRDDRLAVYASKLRADKSGKYLNGTLDDVDVNVDPSALQCFVEHYDECYRHYETLLAGQGSASVFRLKYEELVEEEDGAAGDAVMRKLVGFLGLDPGSLPQALNVTVKQSREPLRQHIINYDEVRYAFSCTAMASCFER